jgi:hypothetical protein
MFGSEGCTVHLDSDDVGDAMEVCIVGEEDRAVANCHCGDHAVDQPARRDSDSPATPIDACRSVEVGRDVEAKEVEAQEKAAKVRLSLLGPGAGQHLHHDRIGDCYGPAIADQFGQPGVDRAAARPVVLDPSRGVGEDQR